MKILVLSKSYPIFGGVERWLADLAAGLARNGHRCRVGLAKGLNFHNATAYAEAHRELDSFTLNGTSGSPIGRQIAVAKALLTERPQIVIPVMLADGLAVSARLKPLLNYKIIYPVHEVHDGILRDLDAFGSSIDVVVTVDKRSHEYVRNKCGGASVDTIPCGVPPAPIGHRRTPNRHVRLGYCGRLDNAWKRVSDLILLIKELENRRLPYTLAIAGEGVDENNIRNSINAISDEKKVIFLGAKSREILYQEFYPRIDVLIITSECETGPLVAFEAMMHGCAVLTSDFVGREENGFLRNGWNALVFPVGDMVEAASHVERVANDPNLRSEIGCRAKSDALREKSLDEMCRKWESLVQSLEHRCHDRSLKNEQHLLTTRLIVDISKEIIRKFARKRFIHLSARAEWPNYNYHI